VYRAGKSTLLQLLASRRLKAGFGAGFTMQGEVLFNGRPMDKNSRSQVAFVEQEDDYHLPALTVSSLLIVRETCYNNDYFRSEKHFVTLRSCGYLGQCLESTKLREQKK
jgi:ABC-type multidrug transport system ATPase subunit